MSDQLLVKCEVIKERVKALEHLPLQKLSREWVQWNRFGVKRLDRLSLVSDLQHHWSITFVHSLLYNDLKIFVPSVFLLGEFCIHYLKKRITYASKIQLFCQVEPTVLTYNIKTNI